MPGDFALIDSSIGPEAFWVLVRWLSLKFFGFMFQTIEARSSLFFLDQCQDLRRKLVLAQKYCSLGLRGFTPFSLELTEKSVLLHGSYITLVLQLNSKRFQLIGNCGDLE